MSNLTDRLGCVRVAIYVRVSTEHQVDRDSLPVQRDELSAYARLVLGAESYEIFEDAGFSAKNTDRPGYQQMMSRIRSGEFTHLLIWKLDRISRNLLDFAAMYEELRRLGVTFVSKNEQFDTSSAMGEAMLKIILVFAELERKMTAERVTSVMVARAAKGKWNGGRVLYGYSWDKNTETFSVVESEAAVVHKIYDMYEANNSLLYVARTLNGSGIHARSGKEWTPTTIRTILRNQFYVGTYRYNYYDVANRKTKQVAKPEDEWVIVEDHHPAIIDKSQFSRVGALLDANRRGLQKQGKTYVRKNIHIFAGMLTCGCCGASMSATPNGRILKDGTRPSNYACMSHRKKLGCPNKFVTDKTIGPFVLNYISNMMKARASFGKTTSPETLQKKLLRGDMFSDVEYIKPHGLMELYSLYKQGVTGIKYTVDICDMPGDGTEGEKEVLMSERRRIERALARLKSLYLYSDNGMPEKEYIEERDRLSEQMRITDKRLEELSAVVSGQFDLSDEEFIEKASFFIISQKLNERRFVNYDRLIVETDRSVVRNFIKSVISNFCIKNGKIQSITFKNGMIHEFVYKGQ